MYLSRGCKIKEIDVNAETIFNEDKMKINKREIRELENLLIEHKLFNKGDFDGCVEELVKTKHKKMTIYSFLDTYKYQYKVKRNSSMYCGYANGCIVIKNHDITKHEFDMIDSKIKVHGGLSKLLYNSKCIVICYDTLHYEDDIIKWNKQACLDELQSMLNQLLTYLSNRKTYKIEFTFHEIEAKMTIKNDNPLTEEEILSFVDEYDMYNTEKGFKLKKQICIK